LGLSEGEYFLATAHRAENVDDPVRLGGILEGFRLVHEEFGMPVVFPAHPRTVKMISEFDFDLPVGTQVMEPMGYLEFLQLEGGARCVLTDSGGLQEEACILGVGCVTLRDNTERPETVNVGANVLVGCDSDEIVEGVRKMIGVNGDWANPYGDGDAGERILEIIE
jgi:UDP-N-acetylglucosamine 2-epimerase (non-hydrolysing)